VATKKEPLTMADLLAAEEAASKPLAENDVIEGKVVSVTKAGIWLDLGVYGTGLAVGNDAAESGYKDSLVGDAITASVIVPEMDEGYALLSLRKASREKSWEKLEDLMRTAEILSVKPFDANKGGLLMEHDGVKGFLPVSQLSTENYPRVTDKDEIANRLGALIGKPLQVVILDVDKKEGKLIFSEKEAKKDEMSEAISGLEIGQKVKGKVTGVVDFGIFMNIDGIEGLVHISEISWDRVEDPSKFAKVGDDLDVVVIGKERDKVSLSLKRLSEDPWAKEVAHVKIGDVIEGEVTRITPFGAFVRITKSVEALVHISELSVDHIANPSDVVEVGKSYKFKVVSVDIENHKLALSLKEVSQKAKKAIKAEEPKEAKAETETKAKKTVKKAKPE
jgi:small subunit ribosomal protein S1